MRTRPKSKLNLSNSPICKARMESALAAPRRQPFLRPSTARGCRQGQDRGDGCIAGRITLSDQRRRPETLCPADLPLGRAFGGIVGRQSHPWKKSGERDGLFGAASGYEGRRAAVRTKLEKMAAPMTIQSVLHSFQIPIDVVFNSKEFAVHDGPGLRVTVFWKGWPHTSRTWQRPAGGGFTQRASLKLIRQPVISKKAHL